MFGLWRWKLSGTLLSFVCVKFFVLGYISVYNEYPLSRLSLEELTNKSISCVDDGPHGTRNNAKRCVFVLHLIGSRAMVAAIDPSAAKRE